MVDYSPFPNYSYLGILPKLPKEVSNISGIYSITCLVNGKTYIGQSRNIANRWRGHISLLRKNESHSPKLQKSWNTYGEKSHVFSLLDSVKDVNELDKLEQMFIKSIEPELNTGPMQRGQKHSEETKAKMRRNHANVSGINNPMYGIKLIGDKNPMFGRKRPDTAAFNTRTKKDKLHTGDHNKKISNSLKGNKNATKVQHNNSNV